MIPGAKPAAASAVWLLLFGYIARAAISTGWSRPIPIG